MQYPTAVRRLGAGLLRNPVPQVFLTLRFTFQAGVSGMSAAGGGLEADTWNWGIFHTSTRVPGGVSGSRECASRSPCLRTGPAEFITPPCQGQEGPSDHLAWLLALQISAGRQPSERSSDLVAGGTRCFSTAADGSVPWVCCRAHGVCGNGTAVPAPAVQLGRQVLAAITRLPVNPPFLNSP